MRFPWRKSKPKNPQAPDPNPEHAQVNAVSSHGPIQTRGHAEVLSWLAGDASSSSALAGVIDEQTRAPKKLVRKISPSPRGTEAVNGWLASPCAMALEEVKAAVSRASSESRRRDSMDLRLMDSPRASFASAGSLGAEVRGYLDNLSEAANTAWRITDEDDEDDASPVSPGLSVGDRYLALVLGDPVTESSSEVKDESPSGGEDDDDDDDGIPWAENAARGPDSEILPLASATVRRPIMVERPCAPVDDAQNILPLRVGQRAQAHAVDVAKSMVSPRPDSPTRVDGPQTHGGDVSRATPATSSQQPPDPASPEKEGPAARTENQIISRTTHPSPPLPESSIPEPLSADGDQHLAVPTVGVEPDLGHGVDPDSEDDIDDYYLDSEVGFETDPEAESSSDSGRDSVGNFKYADGADGDDDGPYDIHGVAAVPHLDTIRKHLSLPPSTPPDEVQMYLARNVEIIRASFYGVICNPGLLFAADKELAASPAAVQRNKAFIAALVRLDWSSDMARGGLAAACSAAIAEGDVLVTPRMRKRSGAHLKHDKDLSWSQLTRLLQFLDVDTVGELADKNKLVRSGRVEKFIGLVAKGLLTNQHGMLTTPGVIKHIMGLKMPPSAREKVRLRRVLGPKSQPSPLQQLTAVSEEEEERTT